VSLNIGFALDVVGQLLRTDNSGDSWQILKHGHGALAQRGGRAELAPRPARRAPGRSALVRRRPELPDDHRQRSCGARRSGGRPRRRHRSSPTGPTASVLSRNGGRSWRRVKRPFKTLRIQDIDLVTSSTAPSCSTRTGACGARSDRRPQLGRAPGHRQRGWATTSPSPTRATGSCRSPSSATTRTASVLRTDDGGATWEPQLLAQERLVDAGLSAPGPSAGFALTRRQPPPGHADRRLGRHGVLAEHARRRRAGSRSPARCASTA